ncbi:hypothetical protein HX773_24525 [Pantoea sp. B9002]|uniref:TrbI/VirB10 family protein n=1 Tax=Pantoea sp. B9002 TaxID=2726979 RepID=UPI00159FBE66|nr:TrbI/VirB10 family protein [Pantoea sp. B9002]NWA64067.1 hypothetical protein [Pantoea sp. B9002]
MVDESKPRVEERPATHKKRMQLYLFCAVGLLLLILFVFTLINVINRASGGNEPKEKKDPQTTLAQQPKQDDLSRLIDSQRTRPQPQVTKPEVVPAGNPYTAKANQMLSDQRKDERSKDRDYASEAQRKWEVQERIRALDSNRKAWGGAKEQQEVNGNGNKTTALARNPQASTLDQQRQLTRQRIEEAERMRQDLLSRSGERPTSSGVSLASANGIASPSSQQQKVAFKQAPADVVGYTKENSYGADTEGMAKIPAGTVIPAITMMTWNSDFPGTTSKAMIDHDVYDQKRENILIPAGSEFLTTSASANGINDPIQNRMGYSVGKAVLPNGDSIDLSKASGLDREGMGGVKDQVEYHFMAQMLGVAAYAMISSNTSRSGTGSNNDTTYSGEVGQGMRDQFAPMAQKYLNIVPTKIVRAGQSIRIILQDDIYVKPYKGVYDDYVN